VHPASPAATTTVSQLLDRAEQELRAAGVVCAQGTATERDEAAALIYHQLGLDHADTAAYARRVDAAMVAACDALIARRIRERMPAAYLLGEAWFAGLPFQVDRRVLVPRSPFAMLIAERFEPWLAPRPGLRILEIGTGSGCIAVACALAFPDAVVLATDISAAALEVADANVRRHDVGDRVELRQADLYDGIRGCFDLILSNPPYVPAGDLVGMPPEFAWEPRAALVGGGADGLDLVRRLVRGAGERLSPNGLLAVEVGGGQLALEAAFPGISFVWPDFDDGADGIALVAAADLPGDNTG
jgi:ribosomal protein L3 glutamine methyltransferase